ncbi:MAG: AAA family ATPase [Planctomycetes bacterium]|nr:AAA family ATPase [Planctomycetota bacterium]
MPVIGLTGPNAAGKGEACAYLRSQGFAVHSLSDIIREELAARGEAPTREAMIRTGNELRRGGGPGALAERLLPRLGRRDVVDSVRTPGEAGVLRRIEGFLLVCVDAPAAVRFERAWRRGRVGDARTLEAFVALEARENTTDPAAQQLAATAALADVTLANDGGLDALHAQLDRLLAERCAPPESAA